MYLLKVGTYPDTPSWWSNLLYGIRLTDQGIDIDIKNALAKWNAVLVEEYTLSFESDLDRTLFLLRWS